MRVVVVFFLYLVYATAGKIRDHCMPRSMLVLRNSGRACMMDDPARTPLTIGNCRRSSGDIASQWEVRCALTHSTYLMYAVQVGPS